MDTNEFKWLPHLENSIPEAIDGYLLGFYSVALEGWRRGLKLKFINENKSKVLTTYELSSNDRTHKFTDARGDLVSRKAILTCIDKAKTKDYLEKAGVPTPKGKMFNADRTDLELLEYAFELGYPLVLKPTDGHGGKGVIAGIKDETELRKAIEYVREDLGYRSVIIEDYFEGEDYRVYVVGNEAVAVIKRIPANIKGDGVSSIQQLIKNTNDLRKKSPILGASLIKIDKELRDTISKKGFSLQSIPRKDELVYLNSKNNISTGGDPFDITDQLSDELKKMAVQAAKSIPNLVQAGVDLMVNTEENSATIIEINSRASIRTHLFPMIGEARDIPKKIIDYYFPETKGKLYPSNFYFEFEPIWQVFKHGYAKEVIVPKMPEGNKVVLKQFVIDGVVQHINYGNWLNRKARELNLHGYFRFITSNRVELVVGGFQNEINKYRKIIYNSKPKNAKISNIVEKEYKNAINIGFKLHNEELDKRSKINNHNKEQVKNKTLMKKKKSKSELKVSKKQKNKGQFTIEQKEKEYYQKRYDDIKKRYDDIRKSKSWRITKPLRFVNKLFKEKK